MAATRPNNKDIAVAPAFLNLMAHELAQPLSAALGSAYTLKDHVGSEQLDAATREHLYDTTIRNLEQLQSLLDSLRVFSEAESGHLKLETAPVAVDGILEDVQGDFGTPRSQTRISFKTEPGLRVEVDLMLFRQVLSNVISNAAKFSPDGSLISVEARRIDDRTILFTVSDEGGGFPEEEAERIFGRSVRLQPGKKGLGVGLYVARAIVDSHDGRIWADNIDKGARFSIAIPAA
ncbi:MAG: sensor histidine kinase [Actinomycetota bacterium]